jgi:hypothetical protein
VVDLYGVIFNAQSFENIFDHQNDLGFAEEGVCAHYVGITLVEFAVSSFLGTVGSPHRLNLVSFKREAYFVTVHYHVSCEGNGEVVAQAFFGDIGGNQFRVSGFQFLAVNIFQKIS